MAEISYRRHRFPPVVIQHAGSICVSRSAIETSRISSPSVGSTYPMRPSEAGDRIFGPEPPIAADLKREADHERLVRAFVAAGEAIEPTNTMPNRLRWSVFGASIEPAIYCFAGMDRTFAVAVVGPSEIGSDCRSALQIWNLPLPAKSLSLIGRPAWSLSGTQPLD
jgi:hypothetical protein